jgi:hypothetical protein
MSEPKEIAFRDLSKLKSDELEALEVWVMNRTANVKQSSGNIALNVKVDGDDLALNIPSTWIPICLTNEVSAPIIIRSPNFRRAYNEGLVTIHDSEECVAYMKRPDAQEEMTRLKNLHKEEENQIQMQVQMARTTNFSSETEIDIGDAGKNNPAEARIASVEQASLAGGDSSAVGVLTMVVQILNDEGMRDPDRMNYLRTNASKLKIKDLQYILKKSTNASIQGWAREAINEKKRTAIQEA